MSVFELISSYNPSGDQPEAIRTLTKAIETNQHHMTLKGVTGSGKTFTLANVIQNTNLPSLVISHNKTLASQLYREFKNLFPNNAIEYYISYYDYYQPEAYIVAKDKLIKKEYSINDEIDRYRNSTICSLLERNDVIVVATVSCLFKMSNPGMFKELRFKIKKGESCNLKAITSCLVNQHYVRSDDFLSRSTFRIKGDSMEIWPASVQEAYRIEFDWGQVDKIWKINPYTFERYEQLDELIVYPAGNFLVRREKIDKALKSIRQELQERVKELRSEKKELEANRLMQRTEYDMELIRNTGTCMGIENYSYHLSLANEDSQQAVLLDFFPSKYLTIIDESHITLPQIKAMQKGNASRKNKLIEYGFRLPSIIENKPLSFKEFENKSQITIYSSATPDTYELEKSPIVAKQVIRPTGLLNPIIQVMTMTGFMEELLKEINKNIEDKQRTLITTISKKKAEILTNELLSMGYKTCYLHSDVETMERYKILEDLRCGKIDIVVGINILREGLDLPEVSLIAILDADKQGFLRSKTSLLQIAGRASRNVNGRVIMFGNSISNAMKEAIAENEKVRLIQAEYNEVNRINPVSITKKNANESASRESEIAKNKRNGLHEVKAKYDLSNPTDKELLIGELKALFEFHAENMDFLEASIMKEELEALTNGLV